MFGFYYDPTYILVLIGAILCIWASSRVNSTYSKYSKVRARSGMTGAEAAQRILQMSGIHDVQIQHISGNLTDHYDPSSKVLFMAPGRWQPLEWRLMSADTLCSIRKAISL